MCRCCWKRICLCVLLVGCATLLWAAPTRRENMMSKDSTGYSHTHFSESRHIYKTRRVSSSYPVNIRTKGNSLLVVSEHSQMLPIYKGNGGFYGLFRLNKGTNWISGLPKGIYIINNSKVVVS